MIPTGPCPAKVMVVGEALGVEEEQKGTPFLGASGKELDRMLQEAGILRSTCFVTNVCRKRPPKSDISLWLSDTKKKAGEGFVLFKDRYVHPSIVEGFELLQQEIALCQPKAIIALGNLPLWVLTDKFGIKNWRGSQLFYNDIPVIPTYHPTAILKQWAWRAIAVQDMKRVASIATNGPVSEPLRDFIIQPNYAKVISTLEFLLDLLNKSPQNISYDIETNYGHIICIGFAWSQIEAICIPFTTEGGKHYWTLEEETNIVTLLRKLMVPKNFRGITQNGLYDSQYIYRSWHFIPNHYFDTMIGQHSCFSTLPKGLDYIASMYCKYYVQWKGIARGLNRNRGVKKDD